MPQAAFIQPVSAIVKWSPSGSTQYQFFAVSMCPRGYAKSWRTILGSPAVPDVKYISMVSVDLLGTLAHSPEAASTPASMSIHPSLSPLRMNLSSSEGTPSAASTCSAMSQVAVHMHAFILAALTRYSTSCFLSMNVAGTITAPILCSATERYQNCQLCLTTMRT